MRCHERVFLLTGLACAAGSCSHPAWTPAGSAAVTVAVASVEAVVEVAGGVTWIHFEVPLHFVNRGSTMVSFVPCASFLEAREGTSWRSAWRPTCSLIAAQPDELAPGEAREVTILVSAALEGPGGPLWEADAIDGTLRYRAGFVFPGLDGNIPTVPSNEFTLTIAK